MRDLEGIEGGELAAALTPQQRMEMVQRGYNPMSPADVQRYYKGAKPADGLHEVAGVNTYKSLGGGREVDAKDGALLQAYEQETGSTLTSRGAPTGNPRDDVKSAMNSYGAGLGNLDDKLSRISERSGPQREQRVLGPGPSRQPQQDRRLIQSPKQTLPIINEAAKAKKAGYVLGVKYINAFIANIKAPSSQNRATLMEEMNKLVTIEDKIDSSLIKDYRQGIAQAESELYNKIKAAKNS